MREATKCVHVYLAEDDRKARKGRGIWGNTFTTQKTE